MINILRDISIYAIGNTLTRGINFIAIVLYSHFLTQNDIGAYGYMLVLTAFVNTFLVLGMDNAYARFFFEYKDTYQKKVLTTTLFAFLILWVFIILLPLVLFHREVSHLLLNTDRYALAFLLVFLSLPLRIVSLMSDQALRNQFKTSRFVVYNFLTSCIAVVSSIFLLNFTHLGLAAIFAGVIIGDLVLLPFRLFTIKSLFVREVDFRVLRNLLFYGIPFVPASFAYWVFSGADRVMLEYMVGLESVGIYTIALSLSSVMNLVVSAIGQAWSPHAVKIYEESQEHARVLYIRFFNLLIAVALLLIFCASLFGREIIKILLPPEYLRAFYPMLILLIGIGFQMTTQVTAVGIGLAKKTMYIVLITLFTVMINISLNYVLIPYYAELGASIASMISYVLLTILYGLVSQKFFPLNYDYKYMLFALCTLVATYMVSFLSMPLKVVLLILVCFLLYLKREEFRKFV